mmetsp:Transcript_72272/g.215656  ORF Transcript_72272/g.215656 Transcript_72272/m.215656 type:complete len:458 (-) Transcript_72272:231-1604(-)
MPTHPRMQVCKTSSVLPLSQTLPLRTAQLVTKSLRQILTVVDDLVQGRSAHLLAPGVHNWKVHLDALDGEPSPEARNALRDVLSQHRGTFSDEFSFLDAHLLLLGLLHKLVPPVLRTHRRHPQLPQGSRNEDAAVLRESNAAPQPVSTLLGRLGADDPQQRLLCSWPEVHAVVADTELDPRSAALGIQNPDSQCRTFLPADDGVQVHGLQQLGGMLPCVPVLGRINSAACQWQAQNFPELVCCGLVSLLLTDELIKIYLLTRLPFGNPLAQNEETLHLPQQDGHRSNRAAQLGSARLCEVERPARVDLLPPVRHLERHFLLLRQIQDPVVLLNLWLISRQQRHLADRNLVVWPSMKGWHVLCSGLSATAALQAVQFQPFLVGVVVVHHPRRPNDALHGVALESDSGKIPQLLTVLILPITQRVSNCKHRNTPPWSPFVKAATSHTPSPAPQLTAVPV